MFIAGGHLVSGCFYELTYRPKIKCTISMPFVNNHIASSRIFLPMHSYKLNESIILDCYLGFVHNHKPYKSIFIHTQVQFWHDQEQPWPHMSTTRNTSDFFVYFYLSGSIKQCSSRERFFLVFGVYFLN